MRVHPLPGASSRLRPDDVAAWLQNGRTARGFYECGCCGHFHRTDAPPGDCREDAERFTADDLDALGREAPDYA